MLTLAALIALLALMVVMAFLGIRWRRQLDTLQRLAADGLLGRARRAAPLALSGSDYETLVVALDDGDIELARGAYRRMVRALHRWRPTGWLMFLPAAVALGLTPLLPAAISAVLVTTGSGDAVEAWHATMAGYIAVGVVAPLAIAVSTLAVHLHVVEGARRLSAAASLLHHAGKELR